LGLVVKTGDARDWAKNIQLLAKDKKLTGSIIKNIKKYKREIGWEKTLQPVRDFALKPHSSADKKNKLSQLSMNSIKANYDLIIK